ncbi:MAG: hypothetical protein ACRD12_06050 [Acidimicrobiales bacterium]
MSDEATSEDEETRLLGALRWAGELDGAPVETLVAAKAEFSLRTLDAELAELAYDSHLDDQALAGVRTGEPTARLLTFESPRLSVEVQAFEAESDGPSLQGQLVPPQPGRVEVRHAGGTVTAETDALGRFAISGLSRGPMRLRCEGLGEPQSVVVTDWILV